MMYLEVKSFIHRDLAARNILVAADGVCKVRTIYSCAAESPSGTQQCNNKII